MLDAGVRPGDRLDSASETVLLHIAPLGHCGDTAETHAAALRAAGWTVAIRVPPGADPVAQPDPLPEPVKRRTRKSRGPRTKSLCTICGHATTTTRYRASHTAVSGHDDWVTLRGVELARRQAQIRGEPEPQMPSELPEAVQEPPA